MGLKEDVREGRRQEWETVSAAVQTAETAAGESLDSLETARQSLQSICQHGQDASRELRQLKAASRALRTAGDLLEGLEKSVHLPSRYEDSNHEC